MSLPKHIVDFLNVYSGFSIAPSTNEYIVLKGRFTFKRTYMGENEIEDSYNIAIQVHNNFPRTIPKAEDIEGRIPRDGHYHVNPDGSFCLGSPLRLLLVLSQNPSLIDFMELLLVPYLYAVSYKLKNGGEFIFGELKHGLDGELSDYENLFQVHGKSAVKNTLIALSTKKRIANKKICPCSCGYRLGVCAFHHRLNPFRKITTKKNYKEILNYLTHQEVTQVI